MRLLKYWQTLKCFMIFYSKIYFVVKFQIGIEQTFIFCSYFGLNKNKLKLICILLH